jgi:ADP-dependent NAD(P)H-hydrate dehydratase / NAD(P)H-hydrate epimerase
MKPVLSPQQAVELDRATQERGVAAEVLMERAGRAVARSVADLTGGTYGRRVVVVCGKGNNGGDGFVAARHLAAWGVAVSVLTVDVPEGDHEPVASNLSRLAEVGVVARACSPATLARELDRADVAVDAIFGTGFRGIPEDRWAAAIAGLNQGPPPVVAVDLPSGVDGGTGAVEGDAVWADLTVTFGCAKAGAVLMPGAERAGALRVVDIGFPDDLIRTDVFLTEPGDVRASLPERPADSHKRASGVLVVVAGSREMTGAVSLIAHAAGRIGTGLVIVAVPATILPVVQAATTEAVFVSLPETADGTVAADGLGRVLDAVGRAHALAIGPGVTQQEETAGFVRDLVRRSPVPVVVDADGLNAFAGRVTDLKDRASDAVLTPHVGEFGRLTGVSAHDLEADRLHHTRALASAADAVALLKGSRTVIAAPDGATRVNPTGTPVLATAGSGDVLTGVIGGLLARGLDPMDAAASGAYLHGLAGSIAGRDEGEGTVASDLIAAIPRAVAEVLGG